MVDGYEIHNGFAKKKSKKSKNLYGTFVHGLFDNDRLRYSMFSNINPNYKGYNFKKYKEKTIKEFARHISCHVDINYIQKRLDE
jgi:adenosylcobyric acid synthase